MKDIWVAVFWWGISFICSLFNDTVSNSHYIACTPFEDTEQLIRKGVKWRQKLLVTTQDSSRGTEANYENPQSVNPTRSELLEYKSQLLDCVWNVMAHTQKPDFVFRWNGWVHLNWRGHQFSWLLAAKVCTSLVVVLDTPCSEVVWRVLATHSIHQFPLNFSSCVSLCAITFQLDSTTGANLLGYHKCVITQYILTNTITVNLQICKLYLLLPYHYMFQS